MPLITVEPTSYAKPWDNLKTSLANSARFQTETGAADADEAKERITFFWKQTPVDQFRAIIRGLDDDNSERYSVGDYATTGPIVVYFEWPVIPEYVAGYDEEGYQNAGLAFLAILGEIRKQLFELSQSNPDTCLNVTGVKLGRHGEGKRTAEEKAPWWGGELIVEWVGM